MHTGGVKAEFRALRHECRQQLEDLLPYPLIIVLQRRGAVALARTLAADISLPTVVWTAGVLGFLVDAHTITVSSLAC